MSRIVFATGNKGKMGEIKEIMSDLSYEVISMKDAGVDIDIVEDGTTFEENALIKARAVGSVLPDDIVLADDSGLEIDALNKEPGIYSARYMGEDTPYEIKNANFIERLEGVPKEERTARFVCCVAAHFPDGTEVVRRATIEGYIGFEPMGENGFGFDPIFYLPGRDVSTAAISPEEKNQISHRGKALTIIKGDLKEYENSHR